MRWYAMLTVVALLVVACSPTAHEEPLQPRADGQAQPSPTASFPPDGDDETRDALPIDNWTRLPDAPLARSEVAAAAFGGQVWVAGGLTQDGQAAADVQVFDPTFETWSAGPELPEAVHHATLVSTGQVLLLVGGYVGSGFDVPTAAVRRLDPAVGAWEDGPALPEPRAAGAAAWDGRRLVYGGGVGPGGVSGDVLVLDDRGWNVLGELAQPREHLAAAGDGEGRVWFLAGRTAGLDTNLATVDLVVGRDVTAIGEVPTPRGGVAGFWSAVPGACAVGGEAPGRTFGEVECIGAEGEVMVLPPLDEPRHGLGTAVVDGIVYVVLGGAEPGLTVSTVVEGLRLDSSVLRE